MPQEQDHQELSTHDLLERFALLRDTIAGLQTERDELGAQLKARLQAGEHAQTELYRAALRPSRRFEYPTNAFRAVFGDAAALEVAVIDRKEAERLAKAGDLDATLLKSIQVVRELPLSLWLEPLAS